jgi:hypothetical protein
MCGRFDAARNALSTKSRTSVVGAGSVYFYLK